jgi:hypothetical protein
MRCWGLHGLANPAWINRFPFYALPCVATYCVPGGVRVVSISPSHLPSTKGSLVRALRPVSQGGKEPQLRRARNNPSSDYQVHVQPVVEAPRKRPEAGEGQTSTAASSVSGSAAR